MSFHSAQEQYWAQEAAQAYIARNSSFDHDLGSQAWATMLAQADQPIRNYLECGCNIGRNVSQLALARPQARPSVIEISRPAFDFVTRQHDLQHAFNGPILDADLPPASFDLVFTMGVLIHIQPDQLLQTMARMHAWSSRYILMGEYFSRTPVMLEYHGQQDRLFKRDFGRLFADNFDVEVKDCGFLWDRQYAAAGFDDITWWLFEKRASRAAPV
jgi:pseudaminic acid biosynthesis-associated methylase